MIFMLKMLGLVCWWARDSGEGLALGAAGWGLDRTLASAGLCGSLSLVYFLSVYAFLPNTGMTIKGQLMGSTAVC